MVKSSLVTNNRYGGLNGSILENKGRMIAKLSLNNTGFKIISLLIVPANTMKTSVVIGRDVLKLFFNSTETTGEEYENQIIQEILNIDIADSAPKTGSELDVNHELSTDIQSTVKDLYDEKYVKPEHPKNPVIDAELQLTVKEFKSFHFASRRLAYDEKTGLRALLDLLLEKNKLYVRVPLSMLHL